MKSKTYIQFLFICFYLFTLDGVSQNITEEIIRKKLLFYRENNLDCLLILSKKLQKSENICTSIQALNGEVYFYYKKTIQEM